MAGLEAGASRRILVAEDHPDNRELITRLLQGIGFEVSVAANGRETVTAFGDWIPDLILMDMRMPVLDGYGTTRAIRALPGGDRVKIVALTASAFREERDAILAAGCDEMVPKPIEEERLFDVLGKLLGVRFRYEAPTRQPSPRVADLDLRGLGEAQRQSLRQAAERLDVAACLALAQDIRTTDPVAAEVIAELVGEYRFDRLLALCEEVSA